MYISLLLIRKHLPYKLISTHLSHCREKKSLISFWWFVASQSCHSILSMPLCSKELNECSIALFLPQKKMQNYVPCLIGNKCYRDSLMQNWIWIDGRKKKKKILVRKLEKRWTTLSLEKKTVKTGGDEESLESKKYQELV